jgi:hypothetical protein
MFMVQIYLIIAFAIAAVGIALLVGFLVFLRRKTGKSRRAMQELAQRLHGRMVRASMFQGDLVEGLHGGIPFTCRFFMGSKNSPPSLTMQIKTSAPARLTIRREAWYDRFARRIGLVEELRTGDPAFDAAYFFDTEREDIYQSYLSEEAKRRRIDALFGLDFPVREIVIGKKDLRIILAPLEGDAIARVPVEKYLEGLADLSAGIPASGYAVPYGAPFSSARPRTPIPRAGLVLLFAFLGLLIAGGGIALGCGMHTYEPLGNSLILQALALSFPSVLVFLVLAFRWIRGRSSSHRFFLIVLILSLIGFPVVFTGGAVFTNGYLDEGGETLRRVPVAERYYRQNKNQRTYYVTFPSWQHPGETDRLSVPAAFFRAVRPGDGIVIRTKPGFWQEEWIAGIERVPPAGRDAASADRTLRYLGIRFYEGPASNVPKGERHFAAVFPRVSARYIWCQVDMENELWQERDRSYTFVWQYLNPDGSHRGDLSLPFTVRRDWQTAWVSHSWGWDDPGNWPPGTYRVTVAVDGNPFGEGTFDIR